MTELDNIKSQFDRKLETARQQHELDLAAALGDLQARWRTEVKPHLPRDIARRLDDLQRGGAGQATDLLPAGRIPQTHALVNISQDQQLQVLDKTFFDLFKLDAYFSASPLNYPTVYCETLEEFFAPIIQDLNLSPQAAAKKVEQLCAQAERQAADTGGGILGVNLPGVGCYLNGWWFGKSMGVSPQQVLHDPQRVRPVLATIAHEKLGHGFLVEYSALGSVKKKLGLTMMEISRRFGVHQAEDALSSLRREQGILLLRASRFLEEGWATWIEGFLSQVALKFGQHPRYSVQALVKAAQDMPPDLPDRAIVVENSLAVLHILFGEENYPPELLHQAVIWMNHLGEALNEHFSHALGQPLCYALGEQLVLMAAVRQGALCAPYAVLIAANLTLDPAQVSLSDLRELLERDHRLYPDARLAALSRLNLRQPNEVRELVEQAWSRFSFTAPRELSS